MTCETPWNLISPPERCKEKVEGENPELTGKLPPQKKWLEVIRPSF